MTKKEFLLIFASTLTVNALILGCFSAKLEYDVRQKLIKEQNFALSTYLDTQQKMTQNAVKSAVKEIFSSPKPEETQ